MRSLILGSTPSSSPHNASMKTGLTRERMIEAIRDLPPDASVDDAIERLVFLAKIEEGLEQLDHGEGIPHDEVKRRFGM
jgi:predicted transcriptional regulator